ncbi:hypothetical protein [Methylogaea oryzae]|nr:hypothetical protein [Methylogaea oryzae]
MRERIGYLSGSTTIESSPGVGTVVVMRLPLNQPPPGEAEQP